MRADLPPPPPPPPCLQGSSDTTVALVFSLQGVAFVVVNLLGVLLAATTVPTTPLPACLATLALTDPKALLPSHSRTLIARPPPRCHHKQPVTPSLRSPSHPLWLLLCLPHPQHDDSLIFRVFLGLGAVPGLAIFLLKATDTYVGHHRAPLSPTRHTARGAGQHVIQ